MGSHGRVSFGPSVVDKPFVNANRESTVANPACPALMDVTLCGPRRRGLRHAEEGL
jgi:hypothetical protein